MDSNIVEIRSCFFGNNSVFFFSAKKLTFAKVSVEGIGVKRWRTNAFARLDAFLVGFALVVARAPLLSWGTKTVVRIATVTVRANALMRSWKVHALCPVTAYLMSDDTLVYIYESNFDLEKNGRNSTWKERNFRYPRKNRHSWSYILWDKHSSSLHPRL